jgi:3-phenylpropionate/trans-cinnamate dioxygenase ferredoxin subunit
VTVPAGFERLALVADVMETGLLGVTTAGGDAICLVRDSGGICAVKNQCTHRQFTLSEGELVKDGVLECSWHGARFDPRTGAVLQGPATEPLAVREVLVVGDVVCVRSEP